MGELRETVPPHSSDVSRLHRMLGRAHEYLEQLKEELHYRAAEINSLHDQLLRAEEEARALRARVSELERQSNPRPKQGG
jgi:septal ring factor EnvC (AmiA/AmiB activator)